MTTIQRLVRFLTIFAVGCSLAHAATQEPMSYQENGVANNIAAIGGVGIISSTNANPSQVTTAAAHNLNDGDTVSIVNHATNTAINGVWTLPVGSVIDALNFMVPVSGNGVGVNTGSAASLAHGGTFAAPIDGDAATAASVDVAFNTLADRTANIAVNTGGYKLAYYKTFAVSDAHDINDTVWDSVTFGANNTYTPTNTPTLWTPTSLFLNAQDIFEVTFDGSSLVVVAAANVVTEASFALFASFDLPGSGVGAPSKIFGSAIKQRLNIVIGGGGNQATSFQLPIHLTGRFLASGPQKIPTVSIRAAVSNMANLAQFGFIGDYNVQMKVWRPTARPQ